MEDDRNQTPGKRATNARPPARGDRPARQAKPSITEPVEPSRDESIEASRNEPVEAPPAAKATRNAKTTAAKPTIKTTGAKATTKPKVTQPKATTQPKAIPAKVTTQPKATQPKATQPKATQPKATQPKATRAKKIQPKATPAGPAPDRAAAATKQAPPTAKRTPTKKAGTKRVTPDPHEPKAERATAEVRRPRKITPEKAGEIRPQAPPPLWPAIKTRPSYAPELLALAAVHHLGGEAAAHASWLRDTYPAASPDALARLAAQRFVRRARVNGVAAGLGGPLALLVGSARLALADARLVLHVAAAYGIDPTDPQRAAELLVLQRIHRDLPTARAALAHGTGTTSAPDGPGAERNDARRLVRTLGRTVGRSLFKIAVARRASRLVPGAGALVAALVDGRDTERLAARAVRHYRAVASSG